MSSESPTSGQWSPRTPLTVSRLAKIANSFGYNLPSSDVRRSPSPSPAASGPASYVLQVIPPRDLPHGSDDILTPPPPSASGYHPNYARGILIPVKPTLASQLSAIAREYALPSTTGLILYLLNEDAPGPRLSEDVWKVLWARIMSSDNSYIPPPTPRSLTLLSPGPYRSSPYANSIASTSSSHLHPTLSIPSPRQDSLDFPPPSTPSAASTNGIPRSLTKSAPPSSISPSETTSASESGQEPDTPLTSADPSTRANSLESATADQTSFEFSLPGLSNPHALVPILAKVEFEIDKRKATWYGPWIRSRRMNHAKRRAAASTSPSLHETDAVDQTERRAVIDLTIGTKDPMPFSNDADDAGEYVPLAESPVQEDPDQTVRIGRDGARDPLADVFGEDEDEWGQPPNSQHNENVVPLALTPGSLSALEAEQSSAEDGDDVQEIKEMINATRSPTSTDRASLATLRKHIPPPLVLHPQSPVASPQVSPQTRTRLPYLRRSRSSDDEAEDDQDSVEIDPSNSSNSNPNSGGGKTNRRRQGVYDDVELDLDQLADAGDRQDQILMKAQLDEIEKTLYQLSPRTFTEFEEQQMKRDEIAQSPRKSQSSRGSSTRTSRVESTSIKSLTNGDVLGRSPETSPPANKDEDEPENSDDNTPAWPATPFSKLKAKRFSSSSKRSSKSSGGKRNSSAPSGAAVPQLAVNGVSTGAPSAFRQSLGARRKSNASEVSAASESAKRKQEADEDEAWQQSKVLTGSKPSGSSKKGPSSPVIPLSPDPFGRFSSTVGDSDSQGAGRGSTYWEDDHPLANGVADRKKASRFSADDDGLAEKRSSIISGDSAKDAKAANRTTLMSVKGIKKLWRKSSRSGSISVRHTSDLPPVPGSPALMTDPTTGRSSPASSLDRSSPVPNPPVPAIPQRPSRPQEEIMDLPNADDIEEPVRPARVPAMLGGRTERLPAMLGARSPALQTNERLPLAIQTNPARPVPHGPPMSRSSSLAPPESPVPPGFPVNMHPSNPVLPNGSISLHPTGPAGNRPRGGSSASPIMPINMLPGGGKSRAVELSFDQETPYPVPLRKPSVPSRTGNGSVAPPPRISSRPPSPGVVGDSPTPTPPPSSSPPPSSDVPRPKSILKSKPSTSQPNGLTHPSSPPGSSRSRRPSLLGRNSSLQATPPDIPPSPRIPEQFLSQSSGLTHKSQGSRSSPSLRSKASSPSLHSHSGSYQSGGSRSSHETTEPEEIDDGQFEIVSPKIGEMKQLSYPYSDLDSSAPPP